eukprot:CAMPEP_0194550058 /NCGR_PEP_ID=MMETSP0253-20130528/95520_1 /TAXON_ID=2966 /ORGANISM="Noctiluca scintillans" /LENGTH=63 /DNA_ID=CAMNT_0039397493 /DNA_START=75 /DNA_END=266 /DNA_ORIENTATION=+
MEAIKEAAKKKIEEEMSEQSPGYIKCCFPCCGGPVGTLDKFSFVIPADKRDDVKAAIDKYKSM